MFIQRGFKLWSRKNRSRGTPRLMQQLKRLKVSQTHDRFHRMAIMVVHVTAASAVAGACTLGAGRRQAPRLRKQEPLTGRWHMAMAASALHLQAAIPSGSGG
jgi:hypothetical protein